MSKISIITASYNSEAFIEDTYRSVINQSETDWEWIISDDASTDSTVSIIKKWNHPKIQLIENATNQGAAVARNKALEKATGRFITFLDSDDLWKPQFLEKSKNYLLENNEALVYSSYERKDEQLQPKLKDFKAIDRITYQRILFNCPIPMLTAMYDTEKVGKVRIPIVEKREDHAMWIEILKKITYARALPDSLGIYRIRNNSYSRNKFLIIKMQFNLYYKYLRLPLCLSIFYTITWAMNGILKYR